MNKADTQYALFVLMVQADRLVRRLAGAPFDSKQYRIWRKALSRYYRRRADLLELEAHLYPMEYD